MRVQTIDEMIEVLKPMIDADEPFPPSAMRVKRGKTSGTQKVHLPEGFLEGRLTDMTVPDAEAGLMHSGG